MSLKALTLVALLLAASVAVAPQAPAQGTSGDVPLIRMRDGHNSDLLFRLNPLTLQQVGRPIRTFRGGTGLSISPDGTRLAFADGAQRLGRRRARSARIHFVDLAAWRSKGVARVGRHGWLNVGWASTDRLVAVAGEGYGPQRLLWVDADTRKVVARRAYSGWTVNTLPVPGGLAVVLGPVEGVGPLRILLLDPNGGVRTIAVDRIRAGSNYDEGGEVLTPAVTVDPDGGRMYAVSARGLLVAEVDLATGAVAYHSLSAGAASGAGSGSLRPAHAAGHTGSGSLRPAHAAGDTGSGDSAPARAAKGNVEVWWRHAAWVGDGRIALTGNHWPRPRARVFDGPTPLGVRTIDTRTWTVTTLDPRPDTIDLVGGMVLAAGTRYLKPGRTKSTGLLAFGADGRRAWRRFRGRPVVLLGNRGELVYAWVRRARTAYVLDRDTGRTLHTIRTGRRVPFLLSPA